MESVGKLVLELERLESNPGTYSIIPLHKFLDPSIHLDPKDQTKSMGRPPLNQQQKLKIYACVLVHKMPDRERPKLQQVRQLITQ